MQIMEYHIISGNVIETRRSYMAMRPKKRRGTRVAGASSQKKILANERETVKRLARILNCNFSTGLLWVTLKYSNGRLPENYEAAQKALEKFLRKLRAGTEGLEYVAVTANWSPKHDRPARLHHHIALPVTLSLDTLRRLWPEGELYIEPVSRPGDLTGLAAYMLANVRGLEPGKKKYSCSKGLKKPVYTEPRPVDEIEGVQALPETWVVDGETSRDDEGRVIGSYIRAVAQEPPKVRGSMVILPRRKRKKQSYGDGESLAEIRRTDD